MRNILGILVDNLSRRESVMPLSRRRSTHWAEGLNLPFGGKTILYTGQMYQLMPSIVAMEKMTSMFENSWISNFYGIGRIVNKRINISRFMTHVDPGEQETFNRIIRNIVYLLREADVNPGYLYGEELYTGALIHDEGVCDVFQDHANKVGELLKRYEVERVITVDPHTTDMLRSVYPKIVKDYKIEVKSYLEVLAERTLEPVKDLDLDAVIHDSCVYARYQGLIDEPRKLLRNAGVRFQEPDYSGKMTFCCGGPVESLYPGKARMIAEKRISQLASNSQNVITMCPICLINLREAAKATEVRVRDISDYLAEAYCDQHYVPR